MSIIPGITIETIDNMSLLEIDKRIEYILEAKRDERKCFFKDLSSLIMYGVCYGYVAANSNKPIERRYHTLINKLLEIKSEGENTTEETIESDLKKLFG